MYVKENKGDKDTYKSTLILTKIFKYLFVHQIENPQKPHAKVKKTREEMQATLEKRKKVVAKFSKSVLKMKNRVKEG
jgi:shikimate kinase